MLRHKTTAAEFDRFLKRPENANRRFELINGEVVEKMPTDLHGLIVYMLAGLIFIYEQRNPVGSGRVEVRYQLPGDEHNAVIPDFSYVVGQKRPVITQGPVPYLPDLAVEIQSPDDPAERLRDKARYYLANGSRLVWLFFPHEKVIEVWTSAGHERLTVADTLAGGDILPGFSAPVAGFFPN